MEVRKTAAHGVKWNAISRIAHQVVGFLVFLILARILTPQAFGLVALAGVYVSFLEFFVSQGFGMAIIQKKDLVKGHLDSAFWMCFGSASMLSLATWFLSGPVARLLGDENLEPILSFLSLGFVLSAMSIIQSAVLTREMRFRELAIREVFGLIGGGVIGIALALKGFGAWSLVGQQLGRSTIGVIVLWKISHWRPGISVSLPHLKELFSYSWAVLSSNLVNFFSGRGDQLLIGKVLGTVPLGYYSIAQKVTGILQMALTYPIVMVTLPILSKMQDNLKKVSESIYKGLEIGTVFSFPTYVGVICLAPEITELAFGDKWVSAGAVIRILMIGQIIHFLNIFSYPTFMSLGKPQYSLWMISVRALCTLGASLTGLRWGLTGVAWGINISSVLTVAFSMILLRRVVPLNLTHLIHAVRVPAVCSTVMALIVLLLRSYVGQVDLVMKVTLLTLTGAASYFLLLRMISLRLFSTGCESLMLLFCPGKKAAQNQ